MCQSRINHEVQGLIALKREELLEKKRQSDLQKFENGKKRFTFKNEPIELENAVMNDVFKNFIDSNDGEKKLRDRCCSRPNNYDPLGKEYDFKINISSSGMVFLLSLFLKRNQMESFRSNVSGYKLTIPSNYARDLKRKNALYFMATQRIYSINCYKGLKRKVNTSPEAIKETLLLQIFDELSKVPKEIYDYLSEDNQKKFIFDLNEYFRDDENNLSFEQSKIIHPVIRLRYEDRFNYFALRFLDEYANFPSLRFHVNFGKIIQHQIVKTLPNSKKEFNRIIESKLNVYGKLSKLSETKYNLIEDKSNQIDTILEFFPNPSYNFPNDVNSDKYANKIGVQFRLNDNNPNLKKFREIRLKFDSTSEAQKKKSFINQFLLGENPLNQNDVSQGEPFVHISMKSLPSIIYSLTTNNPKEAKTGTKIENLIIDKFSKNYLPLEKVKIRERSQTQINEKLLNDIQNLITENENLIKQHEKRLTEFEETRNKKSFEKSVRGHILYSSEKGQIATWLVNDLRNMMPENFKTKWKSHQNSELQKYFSYYDTSKSEILDLLKGWKFYKSGPFILNFSFDTLAEFYSNYIKQRGDFLSELHQELISSPTVQTYQKSFIFLNKKNYKTGDVPSEESKQQRLTKALNLEWDFLDSKKTFIENSSVKENPEHFPAWYVAFKTYNHYQDFYDSHKYPLTYVNIQERKRSEKKIKETKKNDYFLLIIAKHIYRDLFGQDLSLELTDLKLTNNTTSQEAKTPLSKTTSLNLQIGNHSLQVNDVKLKDAGKFRKYEVDNRVETLLDYGDFQIWYAYMDNNPIKPATQKLQTISYQLEEYEKSRRNLILKNIHQIERFIWTNCSNRSVLYNGNYHNFSNYILKGLLTQILKVEATNVELKNITQVDSNNQTIVCAKLLIEIRNKFSHNKFPSKEAYLVANLILPFEPVYTYGIYYAKVLDVICEKLEIKL